MHAISCFFDVEEIISFRHAAVNYRLCFVSRSLSNLNGVLRYEVLEYAKMSRLSSLMGGDDKD